MWVFWGAWSFDFGMLMNMFKYSILIYKKNIKKDLKIIIIIIKDNLIELFIIIKILNHFKVKNEKGGILAIFKIMIIINKFKLKLLIFKKL